MGQVSAQDFLAMIDVVQKRVDGADALLNSPRQPRPLAAGQDTRDEIERDQTLSGFLLIVGVEGDAGPAKENLRLRRLLAELCRVLVIDPLPIVIIRSARRLIDTKHLVQNACRGLHTPTLETLVYLAKTIVDAVANA